VWYEHLKELLVDRGFEIGQIDPTLFTKKVNGELFIFQIYVDEIIFGSSNKTFNDEFVKLMIDKFKMSMMGELKFFLSFEVRQLRGGTFINQPSTPKTCARDLKWTLELKEPKLPCLPRLLLNSIPMVRKWIKNFTAP
jgi:hypothetical protein